MWLVSGWRPVAVLSAIADSGASTPGRVGHSTPGVYLGSWLYFGAWGGPFPFHVPYTTGGVAFCPLDRPLE
jgi:hypothetical protein